MPLIISPRTATKDTTRNVSAHAIRRTREHTGGYRHYQKRQRLGDLQHADRSFTGAEPQHGDEERGGQPDLLGRLGGEIGPGKAHERRRRRGRDF
jgi:hypothetical protein